MPSIGVSLARNQRRLFCTSKAREQLERRGDFDALYISDIERCDLICYIPSLRPETEEVSNGHAHGMLKTCQVLVCTLTPVYSTSLQFASRTSFGNYITSHWGVDNHR